MSKPLECEEAVIGKIRERRAKGRLKYGTTMERTDLTRREWLLHAQQEAMDTAIYLERLIMDADTMRLAIIRAHTLLEQTKGNDVAACVAAVSMARDILGEVMI